MAFQIIAENVYSNAKFPQLDEPIEDKAEAYALLKDFRRLDPSHRIEYYVQEV